MKQLQNICQAIESNLILFIALAIIAGVSFGWLFPNQAKGLKGYSTVALFIMLYPMMIGLRIEEVGKAAANLSAPLALVEGEAFRPEGPGGPGRCWRFMICKKNWEGSPSSPGYPVAWLAFRPAAALPGHSFCLPHTISYGLGR